MPASATPLRVLMFASLRTAVVTLEAPLMATNAQLTKLERSSVLSLYAANPTATIQTVVAPEDVRALNSILARDSW